MNVSEKAAYIKGLMEGMEIDTSKGEGKLLAVMADLLEDLALSVQDLEDENATLREYIEELDEDLGAVEEDFYCCDDDDCDCDCDCCDCDDDDYCDCDDCDDDCDCCDCCECLELECPACGEPVYIDECDIEEIDELECPSCGKVLTIVETDADDDCECECGCCEDAE
ncbi:MAG: zinc ribbon domain-containing protein [Clostridia bacterium]|nr:zinc ribbon domain-containing protein [Clostridia bacterium]